MKLTIFIVPLLWLTGCVQINAPQLENAYRHFSPPDDPLAPYTWILTAGDYRTRVYLFNVQGQQFFTNEANDLILIQGQTITEIRKLGRFNDLIKVNALSDGQRQVIVNNTLYENQVCTDWDISKDSQNDLQIYIQLCDGAKQQFGTVHYQDGEMTYIKQPISYLKRYIELKKQL